MPKTGMAQETGTVIRWYYKDGEHVEKGEPLLEVMTDKVNMDVESPASGVLASIRVQPNQTVPVAQVIAYIAEPGEKVPEAVAAASMPRILPVQPAPGVVAAPQVPLPAVIATAVPRDRVAATPAARRQALERSVDLSEVTGTGPQGAITQADVLRAAQRASATPTPGPLKGTVIPLAGRRRIIADRMQHSAQQAPHIALSVDVDMSEAEHARRGASYTALLVYVVARALRKHPLLNSTLRDGQIALLEDVNVGVAVASDEGLIVPVVKGADGKSLETIDGEVKDLSKRGRAGKLTLEEVTGGTFTISNLGMFGVTEFRAIINPPEAAIMAVGATVMRPVADGDRVVIRPMLTITVSADHRILDGVAVAGFLRDVQTALESKADLQVREPGRLVIIGAGSGGFMAALRAAELGAQVTLVEKKWLGGTCLNEGCIPTKSLVESARRLEGMAGMAEYGVDVGACSLNLQRALERKSKVVGWLVGGLERQLGEAHVRTVMGAARLLDGHHVSVLRADGTQEALEGDAIIVATGSSPATIPGLEQAWTSTEALSPASVPKSLLIVGAGAIGVEFACIYAAFGSKVTLVEALPSVLPREDAEISQGMAWLLQKRGIQVLTASTFLDIQDDQVRVRTPEGERTVQAEKVLVAVGRRPTTGDIGLEALGVSLDRGAIAVDEKQRTNVDGVYAVGDVTGKTWLAHGAFAEGEVAATNALGGYASTNYEALPRCVYSLPEVAAVGLTEQEARARGGDVRVGRASWTASEKALIEGETDGMVKVVANEGRLLGLHIIGPSASVLIMEGTLARAFGTRLDDLVLVMHPHPTLSEAVRKALLQAMGRKV
jgi:dihydrolipoamide dehydrogenase